MVNALFMSCYTVYSFANDLSGKLFLVLNIEIHIVGYVIQCNEQCSVLRLLYILNFNIKYLWHGNPSSILAGCLSQEPSLMA